MRVTGVRRLLPLLLGFVPGMAFANVPGAVADKSDSITYVVRKDDTLYGLTRRYLVGPSALAEVQKLNHVRFPRHMPIGTHLVVPRYLLRFTAIPLRVQSFSGPVSTAMAGQPVDVRKGLDLSEGDEIGTGMSGYVLLAGSDGSRIALPSNSHVRVKRARKYLLIEASDIELDVDKGRADVHAAKQAPDSRFRIRTPLAVTAVRGTIFRAGIDEVAALAATEVIEGNVAVASPKREIGVAAGFGASTNATGEISSEPLLPSPVLLDQGKVQTEEKVAFALKPSDGAKGYRFEVARDAGFEDVIAQQETTEPRAEFAGLRNGTLFLRASAVSRSGLQGIGEIWSFRRQRVGLAAEEGTSALPDGLRINWHAEGEGTSVFRLQIFSATDPAIPLVDEAGLTTTGMTLTGLKRGTYQWRVGVTQTTAEGSAQVWTPLQKFTVSN